MAYIVRSDQNEYGQKTPRGPNNVGCDTSGFLPLRWAVSEIH
jgi:hypothetical protein